MRSVSHLVIVASLLAGVAAPAFAAKKDNQIVATEAFRRSVTQAKAAIDSGNYAAADAPLGIAAGAAQNDEQRALVASMRLASVSRRDPRTRIQVLDELIASPTAPAAEKGRYTFLRGVASIDARKPADAIPFLLRAREMGVQERDLNLFLARAYFDTRKVPQGVFELDRAVREEKAAGRKPPEDWYKVAVAKLYGAGERDDASAWRIRQLQDYPTIRGWRQAIVAYRESYNPLEKERALMLFRLQRQAGALGDLADYLDYANVAQSAGLPAEAIAVIDEGRQAGRVAAGNPDVEKVYTAAKASLKKAQPLAAQEKKALASKSGDGVAKLADAYLASGNTAKAIELYQLALSKGSVDTDRVNANLGIAYARAGRKIEAEAAFAAVKGAPEADIAGFWTAYLAAPPTVLAAN